LDKATPSAAAAEGRSVRLSVRQQRNTERWRRGGDESVFQKHKAGGEGPVRLTLSTAEARWSTAPDGSSRTPSSLLKTATCKASRATTLRYQAAPRMIDLSRYTGIPGLMKAGQVVVDKTKNDGKLNSARRFRTVKRLLRHNRCHVASAKRAMARTPSGPVLGALSSRHPPHVPLRMRTSVDRADRASSRRYPSVRESHACRSCRPAYYRIVTSRHPESHHRMAPGHKAIHLLWRMS
jgi:hypothetical protein